MKKLFNIDALLATLLVFLSMLLFPLLFSFGFFEPFKKTLTDFEVTDVGFTELREAGKIKPDTNIVLINSKGLKRHEIGMLLNILDEIRPKVIGVSIEIERSNNVGLDRLLNIRLKRENIVLGSFLDKNFEINNELLDIYYDEKKRKSWGYLNVFIDKDKEYFTAREFTPALEENDLIPHSFAVSVIKKYDKSKIAKLLARDSNKERIYFSGNIDKFFWIHGFDILDDPDDHGHLKDKILLIGEFTPDKNPYELEEGYYTPLNEESVGRTFPDMYSVVLQANIVSMILNERYYDSLSEWIAIIIAFLLCYVNMIIFGRVNIKYKNWYEITSVLLFLMESIVILFLTVLLFHEYDFELNLNLTIFAIALSVFVFEGYNESVKPLTIKAYNYIFKR